MTIVNMVGGGGSSEADWNITVSYQDPKITVSTGSGNQNSSTRSSYSISRGSVATGYNGKCYKLTAVTALSSQSSRYNIIRYASYDITNISIPELTNWVSTYNIKNASGTVKGYWSTYGNQNGYSERVFLSDPQTYNVTVSSGIMTITNSKGTTTMTVGMKSNNDYKAYGIFYPTDIDIRVV